MSDIPLGWRFRAVAANAVSDLVKSLRKEAVPPPARKAHSGRKKAVQRNPWPRCQTCHQRHHPGDYLCGKPAHQGMCPDCCGYPHDDEDE